MADFSIAIEKTLEYEGGYVDNPNDPGGATNWGITIGVLQSQGSLGDVDGNGAIDKTDVKLMTRDTAIQIYRNLYWKGDNIDSQAIAEKHFDIGVNMGVGTAAKYLQQAAVKCGQTITVDGNIGPKTISAINNCNESMLMSALCDVQENHYWHITLKDIEKNAGSRGWPEEIIEDAILACKVKNLDIAMQCLKQIKALKLKEGRLVFLRGWLKRGSDRFGV